MHKTIEVVQFHILRDVVRLSPSDILEVTPQIRVNLEAGLVYATIYGACAEYSETLAFDQEALDAIEQSIGSWLLIKRINGKPSIKIADRRPVSKFGQSF